MYCFTFHRHIVLITKSHLFIANILVGFNLLLGFFQNFYYLFHVIKFKVQSSMFKGKMRKPYKYALLSIASLLLVSSS